MRLRAPSLLADGPAGRRDRSVGLDAARGLAILMVIVQHTVPGNVVFDIGGAYWIHQAVPIFLIILGLNAARGFRRSGGRTLHELYSRPYLVSRVRRLIMPAIAVYVVIAIVAALDGRLHIGGLVLLGAAPLTGGAPGDYFVGLVVAIALLLPLIWRCFLRAPKATIIGLVLVSVVFELAARHVLLGLRVGGYLDGMSPLRAGAALAAGIWIAEVGGPGAALTRRRVLVVLAVISGLYLAACEVASFQGRERGFGFLYPNFTVDTGVWAVGWSIALTLALVVALDHLGERSRERKFAHTPVSLTAELGKASYHIFLVQAAIFGLWLERSFGLVVIQSLLALSLGWLFWAMTARPRAVGEHRAPPSTHVLEVR